MSRNSIYLKRTIRSKLGTSSSNEPLRSSSICCKVNPSYLSKFSEIQEEKSFDTRNMFPEIFIDDVRSYESEETFHNRASFSSLDRNVNNRINLTNRLRNYNECYSKNGPCCYCKKLTSISNEFKTSPELFHSEKALNFKICRCSERGPVPHAISRCCHKNPYAPIDDWFDNHAIPEYIGFMSKIKPGDKKLLHSIIDTKAYSRTKCGCVHCNLNVWKMTAQKKENVKEKKCSRCGISRKDDHHA